MVATGCVLVILRCLSESLSGICTDRSCVLHGLQQTANRGAGRGQDIVKRLVRSPGMASADVHSGTPEPQSTRDHKAQRARKLEQKLQEDTNDTRSNR